MRWTHPLIITVAVLYVSGTAQADPDSDWLARSTGPGVLMATRFDTAAEVSDYTLQDFSADHVSWERTERASGNGSLRMDIYNTDSAASGNWVRYLSDDRRDFRTGDTFYVQFRQYFPEYFATHAFAGGQYGGPYASGWKQTIISNRESSNQLFEVVLQNTDHRGLVQGYNRNSDGAYLGWDEDISTACSEYDYVYQNMIDRGGPENTCLDSRRRRGGLYSYGSNRGGPDPETGAFIYYPHEWLTFLVKVSPGTFGGGSNVRDTNVQVWASRAADTDYTLLIDVMVNIGEDYSNQGQQHYYDAIWLLPYNTLREGVSSEQNTYTLYDELIVSTQFIPAPNSGGIVTDRMAPMAPTALRVQ